MNTTYRLADIKELKRLNKISVQSKAHWGYPASWMEKWKEDLTLDEVQFSKQNIMVAELEDELIGFCSMVDCKANYEITHLWVLPAFIGKGIGKKLLFRTIETFAKEEKPIIVEADPNAESFYEKQGFVTFDKVESYPKGRFLPIMKKLG
jgi:GNAT superfamily N-acetyltransferase